MVIRHDLYGFVLVRLDPALQQETQSGRSKVYNKLLRVVIAFSLAMHAAD